MSNIKEYIRVQDVMTPELKTIEGLATISEAIETMKNTNYGSLIVNKRDNSDEYGLVTVQEIASKVIEHNLKPERVHVYEVMEKPVLTVRCDMNIRYAIRLLDRVNQSRALVIENGTAIGIITMYDMVIHYMDKK